MKKIYILFIAILYLSAATSCEDVLNRTPVDTFSADDVFNDEALTAAYLVYLYQQLPLLDFQRQVPNYSDEVTFNTTNTNPVTQGTVSRSSEVLSLWNYSYIRKLNSFIEQIRLSPFSEDIKRQYEGEARFLRAFVYFEMQKRYGGVPLVDIVIDPYNPIDKKYTVRSSEETIAGFIDNELAQISGFLSAEPLPKGRINKWTILALHARSALWSASIAKYGTVQLDGLVGIPSDRANEFYSKAVVYADSVIKSGMYALYYSVPEDKSENYRKIFMDEGNSEVIFERIYDGLNIGHNWDGNVAPYCFGTNLTSYSPTLEFVLSYENIDGSADSPLFGAEHLYTNAREPFANKDPRLFATVFFEGDTWRTYTVRTYEGIDTSSSVPDVSKIVSNPSFTYKGMGSVGIDSRMYLYDDKSPNAGFLLKKYLDDSDDKITVGMSKTNWIEFRLAEVYLIKAEALFELEDYHNAAEALNATRERAGISLVDATTITLEKVRNERKVELAFENSRYWDLRRWRTAESVLNYRFRGLRIIYHYASEKYYFLPIDCETFSRVFRPQQYYNPITTSRLNNNPDLIENPLY